MNLPYFAHILEQVCAFQIILRDLVTSTGTSIQVRFVQRHISNCEEVYKAKI